MKKKKMKKEIRAMKARIAGIEFDLKMLKPKPTITWRRWTSLEDIVKKWEVREMSKLTRGDVLRKCILIVDTLKRMHSRGNAGLVAEKGAEESFELDQCMSETLREMLRELEAGEGMKEWQKACADRPPERLEL